MIKLFLGACLLSILALCSGCDNKNEPAQFSFNSQWQFTRINQENVNQAEIENQKADWASQYDVTYVTSSGDLQVPAEILSKEFKQLESSKWDDVSLPHTPVIEDLTVLRQWQGICYYKKQFIADKQWENQLSYIEFEGAMHLADVWVNGKHITQHAGGYTPFVIEVSKQLKWNEQNEILVRLDNTNNPLIPPGKPVEDLDFNYFGGLYRDVNFIVKNKIHITHPILANEVAGGGVFVTYNEVTNSKAVINVQTHVLNETEEQTTIKVRQRLIEINGLFKQREIGNQIKSSKKAVKLSANEAKHITQIIELENPQLWSPEAPHLYILKTEILHHGKVIDSEEQKIGVRELKYSIENGFEINGQKLRLVGSNRHMDYPYVGNAISDNAQYRDIYHIKESGFNTVRLGHYPQDKSVLEACDELGVLAIEPIPGWQFFNNDKQFCELTYQNIRDMIRRDRNHASVIMWEVILNEAWPPTWWKENAVKTAHEEYPGNQCFTSGDSYGFYGWDVQYNDWEEGFNRPNNSGKAGFIREYYDYEFGGHYSTTRITRGDGEKALLQNAWNAQWSHNRYRAYYPATTGDAVWSMYDYNRGCCDNICYSGVANIFRIDKFSIPFYKSQMSVGTALPSGNAKPYIFIANYWDNQPVDDKLIIYSNTDEVTLYINDKEIAKQNKDNGEDSKYGDNKESWYTGGNSFDGGNCKQLENAPFTFNNIDWQSGEIKAVGYINGKKVCVDHVLTPETPSKLAINYFVSGKPATKNDIIIVYVRLEDEHGTLCVNDSVEIKLDVIKGGTVIGPATMLTEVGISSFLVKTNATDQLEINAKSKIGESSIIVILED